MERKYTREVVVGGVSIGGGSPVSIQSMTNTRTADVESTLEQIHRICRAGAELVRVAVPDEEAVEALSRITVESPLPVVADIHFRHDLALMSLENGAHKIRINPGNLGGREKYLEVINKAKEFDIPVRIGVNSGSLEKEVLKRYGGATPEAMVESALNYVGLAEKSGFDKIVLSLKASSVPTTVEAYRLVSQQIDYPLHIGVTEAGSLYRGSVKSAVGIGALLSGGTGDTVRVSLSSPPEKEIEAAKIILQALELREFGPEIVSCPTCGRCEIEVQELVEKVEQLLEGSTRRIKVAVMGCPVNGPGEAREADLGITGTPKHGILFKEGKIIKRVPREGLMEMLKEELKST